jgi:hypothetical protein
MGIREMAQKAIVAEEAAKTAEVARIKGLNEYMARQVVKGLLGLECSVVSVDLNKETNGNGAVVAISDETGTYHLLVRVIPANHTMDRPEVGMVRDVEYRCLVLCGPDGKTYIPSPVENNGAFYSEAKDRIKNLADLGRVLEKYDSWLARQQPTSTITKTGEPQ